MGFVEIINHHQPLRQRPHSGTGTGSGVWSLDVRVFKHTLQTKLNRDCMRQCTCSCGRMENGERRKEKGEEGVEGFLFGTIALYCFHVTRKYSFIHRLSLQSLNPNGASRGTQACTTYKDPIQSAPAPGTMKAPAAATSSHSKPHGYCMAESTVNRRGS
jgi:hypothetical protein